MACETYANRAIELDPSWAKGYVRLGEVFAAMHRHREAIEAYDKAIPLCDAKQQEQYRTQQKKLKTLFDDRSQTQLSALSPDAVNDNWFIKLMERDIPDPKNYNNASPCPLGYLTAADKIYCAFVPFLPHLTQLPGMERGTGNTRQAPPRGRNATHGR